MEFKNSGIPGPGAITWKRKSLEEPHHPNSNCKSKKRKVQAMEGDVDPYSFHEDEIPEKKDSKSVDSNGSLATGGAASSALGPVYKYKSAMLSREVEKEEEKEEKEEKEDKEEKEEGRGESDESSRSSNGGSLSPVKKKYKRPKLEEWSVAPKSVSKPGDRPERPDKTEGVGNQGPKKGPLWGLPIMPKPPQKPEKPRDAPKPVSAPVTPNSAASAGKVDVKNVWLQAFGAGNTGKPPGKSKKKPVESADSSSRQPDPKKPIVSEKDDMTQKTILDIPPEVRRKSRPTFGGLIHFSPDWVRSVRRHHERCRLPPSLENSLQLKPKVLVGQTTPRKSYEDFARKDMVSPPDLLAMERDRVAPTLPAAVPEPRLVPTTTQEDELPGQLPSIVESILANRKKLREAAKMGRMYKIPFQKEKKPKRMAQTQKAPECEGAFGLLPTPGLPVVTEDSKGALAGTTFGGFRQSTLQRYIEKDPESKELPPVGPTCKARKPGEVLGPGSLKEIFGLVTTGLTSQPIKKEKTGEKKVKVETNGLETPVTTPKKEKKKKEVKQTPTVIKPALPAVPVKSNKFRPVLGRRVEPGRDDGSYSQEVGAATDHDNSLQTELGGFALDLLDDNLSWAKRVAIMNLVIWEPAETPIVINSKKKKGKKKRTRKSGLDFSTQKRKGRGATSATGSRANSPAPGEEPHEVIHSVNTVVAESSRCQHQPALSD